MGEYAEMMLDGTCCECCGAFIGEPGGFPRYCSPQCAADRRADYHAIPEDTAYRPKGAGRLLKTTCLRCGKICKSEDGLAMHMRDKHGVENADNV